MISTFGSLTHARNWAQKWSDKHPSGTYYIATIDVTDDLYVFRAVELVSIMVIPLSGTAKKDQLRDEYLIFRNIDNGSNVLHFEDEYGNYTRRSHVWKFGVSNPEMMSRNDTHIERPSDRRYFADNTESC